MTGDIHGLGRLLMVGSQGVEAWQRWHRWLPWMLLLLLPQLAMPASTSTTLLSPSRLLCVALSRLGSNYWHPSTTSNNRMTSYSAIVAKASERTVSASSFANRLLPPTHALTTPSVTSQQFFSRGTSDHTQNASWFAH